MAVILDIVSVAPHQMGCRKLPVTRPTRIPRFWVRLSQPHPHTPHTRPPAQFHKLPGSLSSNGRHQSATACGGALLATFLPRALHTELGLTGGSLIPR